ncbi:MAG: Rieske 2Fe-2S domain-containing protein, partial [Acidiferrobacteraceae bacterium]|nr:Rieske 2Fe-2S domain-containing protein [Acidiferrobacteraceae bacterium]
MGEWASVARVDEVSASVPLVVDLDDAAVVLVLVDDEIIAIEDICTHDGGEISEGCIVDGAIECPRHGARFCLRTGKVLSP